MNSDTITTKSIAPAQNQGITQHKLVLSRSVVLRWLEYLDVSPASMQTYAKNFNYFCQWLELMGIDTPIRTDVLAYRDYLKETHKATTVQNYMAAVKSFFEWTALTHAYPNIAEHIKSGKISREFKKDYFSAEQVKDILETFDLSTLKGRRDYAVFILIVTCGLRTIEVTRANIEDMRMAAGNAVLYIQGKGRDDKAEYVKLVPVVDRAIRSYLSLRGENDSTTPLFASVSNHNSQGRMTTRSIRRITKEQMLLAGFNSDRFTAHSLRHTAATLNMLNGGTLEETKQLLRHANVSTTLIYSHALERANNKSEERIADAIFSETQQDNEYDND